MSKITKIVSGSTITLIDKDHKPHLFALGGESNQYLYTLLKECDDDEKIENILKSPGYANYIRCYNQYPQPRTSILEHGHKARYVCTDYSFSYLTTDDNFVKIIDMTRVTDIASAFAQSTQDDAIAEFVSRHGDQPAYCATFCTECLNIHKVLNFSTDQTTKLTNEEVIHVG